MRAWANDYPLNDPAGSVLIHGAIEGLSTPDIRRTTGLNMGRNGGYHGKPFFEPRNIGIPLTIVGRTIAEYENTRAALTAALLKHDGEVTLRLVTPGGRARVIYCYVRSADIPYGPNPLETKFSLELVADDAVIYDDTPGATFSALLEKTRGGGFAYPFTYPKVYGAGVRSSSATNSGDITIFPKITLTGKANTPIITNWTTGESMKLNLVTSATDVVKIDNSPNVHTVLLNDVSVYGKKVGQWISLAPGVNDIELTTSTSDDSVAGIVFWRGGYLSL